MEKKYDIFISYRREGGYDTAKHLYDLLTRDGYHVSFDIDTLRNGDFDEQLYARIDSCKDFILIVDRHAFDRTVENRTPKEHDWLRCELAYALKQNKNIIPIFLSGVTGFPQNLPEDIIAVTKKNGPEFNRYYFNDFYRVLKDRFLQKRRIRVLYIFIVMAILALFFVFVALYCFKEPEQIIHTNQADSSQSHKSSIQDKLTSREDILELYSGSFSIVYPGAMKEGITWVYEMVLDPVHSKCKWIEKDFVRISDSKGYCGTIMQCAEAWNVYKFSLHNSLKYAIVELEEVDDFYAGENRICKVKLELDSFNNIKMSFIEGNSAPAPLLNENGEYSNIVTFYRE